MKVTFKLALEGYKCFKYEELHGGAGEKKKFSLLRTGTAFSEKQILWAKSHK